MSDRLPLPKGFLTEPVPNNQAVKWIENKTPVGARVFEQLLPELKGRAIAVAGIHSASVAREVRKAIASVPAGADWDKQKHLIADQISPWLMDDSDSKARKAQLAKAEILLRTHGFQAYAVVQHETMREQEDIFPFWQYLSMDDEKVRQSHQALHDLVFPANSPFWKRHSPPWEWGCRCRKVQLLPEEVDEIREREKQLPPDQKTVIEGPALSSVEQQNKLVRGPSEIFDLTPPIERGKEGAFVFEPDSLRLTTAEIRGRYDPLTWADWEAWAKNTTIEDLPDGEQGLTVWDWMEGRPFAKPKSLPAESWHEPLPEGGID